MLHRIPKKGDWVFHTKSRTVYPVSANWTEAAFNGVKGMYCFCKPPEVIEPPKPKEIWVNLYSDGSFGSGHLTEEGAKVVGSNYRPRHVKTIHFREVIEE